MDEVLVSGLKDRLSRHPQLAGAALGFFSFLLYSGTLSNGFVYDDGPQIFQNRFVVDPRLWRNIFTGPVWSFMGPAGQSNFYRPLQFSCYWLLYRIAGPNPGLFHFFQLLLFALTAWLVFRLGRELLRNDLAAFAGALLWAVHPLHVEAVAWTSALPDVGCGVFYLLGFLLFLRAESLEARRLAGHVLAALAYFPALFFKEMALSFPLLVAAYWFFLGREERWWARITRWTPYLAAVGIYAAIRVAAIGHFTHTPYPLRMTARVVGSSVALLGEHTRMFFWPVHLTVYRTFEMDTSLRTLWPWVTLALLFVMLLIRKRQPLLSFLIFWWAIGLVPCLDIRQLSVPLLAERFSYLPSVGLCLGIAFLFLDRLPQYAPGLALRRVLAPALGAVLLLWSVQTVRAVPHWHDNASLSSYGLQQAPSNPGLHVYQAQVYQFEQGNLDAAAREYEAALKLNEATFWKLSGVSYDAYVGLGQIAVTKGQMENAVQYFETAIRLRPNLSDAYDSLGAVYFPRGEYTKAAECFSQAVKVNPNDLGARFYLGSCWMKLGKYAEAAQQFRAARTFDAGYRQAYEAEARALEAQGNLEEAARVRRVMPPL